MIDFAAWLQGVTWKRLLIYSAIFAVGVFGVSFLTSHLFDKWEGEFRHKALVGIGWGILFTILVVLLLFLDVTNYAAFTQP